MEMKIEGVRSIAFIGQILLALSMMACEQQPPGTLQPAYTVQQDTVNISKGALSVTFVNNASYGALHRAGYNGIAELIHTAQDSNIFVPLYAGFNLEHIFDGDSLIELFEPRRHPMFLYRKGANEIALHQPATPVSGVESLTEFKVVAPHYIDITFKCLFHYSAFFDHGYAGLFWASYIQHPQDKRIYFEGFDEESEEQRWIAAYSEKHGENSTHMRMGEKQDLYFAPNFNATLASHFSDYNFKRPFFFGRFHNMALSFFFETEEVIRFSQSPTGGGQGCPAWDFQYLIPNPKMNKIYSFKARLMYKPFVSAEDILYEFEKWANQ